MQSPGHLGPGPAPGAVAPVIARPGWWARNWKWAVPGIGLLVAALVLAFCGALFMLILGVLKGTEVYQTALEEAQAAPAVARAIGRPVEEGLLVVGNIEVSPASGYADLAIPIKGPDGGATVYVVAEKSGGEWLYDTLEVAVHDTGETIDLLADW